MNLYNWRHRRAILPTALLASLCFLPAVAHSAASYLQELEAEASRTDNEQAGTQPETTKQQPDWASGKQKLSETISTGLSKQQFEKQLKESYYGSYLFYSTLNDADQQQVYDDYKQNNAIVSIRESIKTHMKSE